MKESIYNADHPATKKAIEIIEQVIEPHTGKGIEGEEYHDMEVKIAEIVAEHKHLFKPHPVSKTAIYCETCRAIRD